MPDVKPGQPQINNPDAGKIKVIVSGRVKVTSSDPRVVIVRRD